MNTGSFHRPRVHTSGLLLLAVSKKLPPSPFVLGRYRYQIRNNSKNGVETFQPTQEEDQKFSASWSLLCTVILRRKASASTASSAHSTKDNEGASN